MKLSIFLFLVALINVQATAYSQKTKITLDLENVSVEKVLTKIQSLSEFNFIYNDKEIDFEREVSIKVKNERINKILNIIFKGTNVNFKVLDKQILLKLIKENNQDDRSSLKIQKSEQEQRVVLGTVTDEENLPLPGATVLVKGTTNGITTDLEGAFKLSVSAEAILTISYVGYKSQEIIVGTQSVINIQLQVAASELDEVVLIGYGTQKKRDVTGAISSIGAEEIEKSNVSSFESALQGKLAGVSITQQSGSPGSEASIIIRGVNTFGNNAPLFVIDGVQSTGGYNTINPNDIESITVLKDASAAAIYGSRAAHGVIIVKTKRGAKNSETKVSVSAYVSFSEVSKKLDVLNASEYATIIRESRNNANAQRTILGDALLDLEPLFDNPSGLKSLTNWQDEVYNTGITQNYNLSISGGSEKTNYAVSASFRDEEGIIQSTFFKRFTFDAKLDHDVNDKLRIGTSLNFSYRQSAGVPNNDVYGGVALVALEYPEMFPVRDENGEFFELPRYGNASLYGQPDNPVALFDRVNEDLKDPTQNVRGNIFAEYDIIDGLKLKTSGAFNLTTASASNFSANFRIDTTPENSSLTRSNSNNQYLSWDNTLTYSKRFNNHNITTLIGMSAQHIEFDNFSATRLGYPTNDLATRYLDFGDIQSNSGTAGALSLLSYFARGSYSFKDKYLLTATVRRDGSSRFTTNNEWGVFPSVSAGWIISEESFLKNTKWLSNLKLRASWGSVGDQNVGGFYPTTTSLATNSGYDAIFGDAIQPGMGLSSLGNPGLTWESTEMYNYGLDLSLFGNQFELTAEYYINKTSDLFVAIPLPKIIGNVQVPEVNVGDVTNKGFELSALYRNSKNKFSYSIGANASFTTNEVTYLGVNEIDLGNSLINTGSISRITVGDPIGSFYGFQTDGLFQSQAEVDAHATQGTMTSPGDIRFVDTNEDGVVNDLDRVKLGDGFPDVTYGVNFSAAYKGFDFYLYLQGVSNVSVFNAMNWAVLDHQGGNKSTAILGRWTPENPTNDANMPRLDWDNRNSNDRISDRYIEDASYMRVKDVQVGYNFNKKIIDYLNFSQLRIYISAKNLYTFSDYSGLDPEMGGNALTVGVDQGNYPQPKTVLVGVNIGL